MILRGRKPTLSIEITKECPLHCPGCYAYEPNHLGGSTLFRQLNDYKGEHLVSRILALADLYKPLHLSIVGGDPLVRYREVAEVLPPLLGRGIHVQVVTSAFRPMPADWKTYSNFTLSVSVDGLQPEHDLRRAPATYERILKNIENQTVTVHCTVTGQMMKRENYLEEFVRFWSQIPQVKQVWFSLFTPQRGEVLPEILTPEERRRVVAEVHAIRQRFPKLAMPARLVDHFTNTPSSPKDCIFSQVTETISADFQTKITPCQFGGDPDCSQCGCMASMALAAVGSYKVGGLIPASALYRASSKIGSLLAKPLRG